MKKFIFLVWVLVFLGGCASEARVAVLEKQVAELEARQTLEKQKSDFSWKGEKGFSWQGGNFTWQ